MPDETGKLSMEERQKILTWLTDRGADKPCESCGNLEWALLHYITTPIVNGSSGIRLGGVIVPTITISCKRCGLFRNYSAVQIGIVPQETGEGK
jgi:hypothetical protein